MKRFGSAAPLALICVVALFLAMAQPAFASSAESWTMCRGDPALTGVAAASLPADLKPLWTFEADEGIESTAAIADGRVFLGTLDAKFHALDLATGKELWEYDAELEIMSSPSVRDGVVYFGDGAGIFHAVDAATGKARWTFETEGEIISSANFYDLPGKGGYLIVFGSYDAFLYALKPDGTLAWKVETESYVHATPALADGLAVFGGCDGYFRGIDLATGKETKTIELGSYVAASAAISGGRAFVGDFDSAVVGVDLTKEEVLWRYENPKSDFPYYSSPALAEGLAMLGGRDKKLVALDTKTGEKKWSYTARSRVDASPVVVGKRVFSASKAGDLFALEIGTGEVAWSYDTGEPIVASPAVANGKLVIATLDGTVFAFGAKP